MNESKMLRAFPILGLKYTELLPREFLAADKDYFQYTVTIVVAGTASGTGNIPIQSDSDFICISCNAGVFETADPTNIIAPGGRSLRISIQDGASGRLLQNAPVWLDNFCGSGTLPGFLAGPKFFGAAGSILTTIDNLIALAVTVDVTYAGVKVFNWAEAHDPV